MDSDSPVVIFKILLLITEWSGYQEEKDDYYLNLLMMGEGGGIYNVL